MNSFDSVKWLIYSGIAAAGCGVQYAIAENMLKTTKPVAWVTYYIIGAALGWFIYLVGSGSIKQVPGISKGEVWPMIACVVVGLIAQIAILSAICGKNATHASLIENAVPLFAILASAIFFGEWHLSVRSGIGAVLVFAGMALVAVDK